MEAATAERKEAEKNGNGEALDGEHADQQAPPALPPVELEGSGDQLTLKITGAAPDKGTAKMQGGKIEIPKGEYQPGEVVEAVVRMRCTEVAVIDKMNNTTGDVTERERVHRFKVMGIEKITT
jgi:hypothetical protein